jgi:hypothetical protein
MKKICSAMVLVAAMAIFMSSAQAAVEIQEAEVRNGVTPAPIAKTGQTVSIAPGDDGALRKAWPGRIRDSPTTLTGRSPTI